MDILDQFENDEKILQEVKSLLEFAPPASLRRSLEELFFHCFMASDNPNLPAQSEVVTHVYYLINFLNEVEGKVE